MRLAQSVRRPTGQQIIHDWFSQKGWRPFAFQKKCWQAYQQGNNYLLHSSTGSGKTMAAWLGPVIEFLRQPAEDTHWNRRRGQRPTPPLTVLWITPLRALSADTESALRQPIEELDLPWSIESRTGDSSSSLKARHRKFLPTCLITTPESLSLLLSYPDSLEQFRTLKCIVVDEWHELMGTKRGVQTELALSRLKTIAPKAARCGLSATLGNLDESLACLIGQANVRAAKGKVIRGASDRKIQISTIVPKKIERFPWAGHLGLSMAREVIAAIEQGGRSLVFTNTRNQAENWYRALLALKPDWAGELALHHGSLDRKTRRWVETAMSEGKLKAVVCTSSLDLGIDFSPVTQVIHIGSPKGVARLVQRAGRSGHQPGGTSRLHFVPTHAFELIELAAAKRILHVDRQFEARRPLVEPLDCLCQHAVTMACAQAFTREQLAAEVRDCRSYRDLSDEDLNWVLSYIHFGGTALKAYADFHRVQFQNNQYQVTHPMVARKHRMAIGTITSDLSVEVKFLNGQRLGTLEESFVGRLKPGDRFQFAGRTLELFQLREGTAIVKKSKSATTVTPRWLGGRMPLSANLANEIRKILGEANQQIRMLGEMKAVADLIEIQKRWSVVPRHNQLLVESFHQRGRFQICCYTLDGRLVHEGLSALIAYRLSLLKPRTIMLAVNDYGWMLDSDEPLVESPEGWRELLNPESVDLEIDKVLNGTEMAKRQFREIAQIAGLIHPGYPGQPKRARHLQASANMFYDAFINYDRNNFLLRQANQEVLERQLEWTRLKSSLERLRNQEIVWMRPKAYTPFAFPLVVEQLRERVSSETLDERIRKLVQNLDRMADEEK